jgi:hypothetical protein
MAADQLGPINIFTKYYGNWIWLYACIPNVFTQMVSAKIQTTIYVFIWVMFGPLMDCLGFASLCSFLPTSCFRARFNNCAIFVGCDFSHSEEPTCFNWQGHRWSWYAASSWIFEIWSGNFQIDLISYNVLAAMLWSWCYCISQVVDSLYDCKSEVIGPGFFRFKAEIGITLIMCRIPACGYSILLALLVHTCDDKAVPDQFYPPFISLLCLFFFKLIIMEHSFWLTFVCF